MIGQTIPRYRIVEKRGGGGMGEVRALAMEKQKRLAARNGAAAG